MVKTCRTLFCLESIRRQLVCVLVFHHDVVQCLIACMLLQEIAIDAFGSFDPDQNDVINFQWCLISQVCVSPVARVSTCLNLMQCGENLCDSVCVCDVHIIKLAPLFRFCASPCLSSVVMCVFACAAQRQRLYIHDEHC